MGEYFSSIAIIFGVIIVFGVLGKCTEESIGRYDKYRKSLDACIIKHKELPAPDTVCKAMIWESDS